MLGYKFTNIKIQTAYIKQIIYSYLFNIFLVSPNYFVIPLLSVFSKDSLSLNSKESYESMINQNNQIKDDFYKKLEEVGGKRVKNYMYLTAILNKNIKINFNNLSNDEIEKTGSIELDNLFFEVFLEFLDSIREEYNISNNAVENITFYENNEDKKYFASNSSSVEGLINDALFIETLNNFETPVFITSNRGKTINKSLGFTDSLTKIDNPYKTQNVSPPILEQIEEFISENNMNGIVADFHYKIKETIPVELSCGSKARSNPVLVSTRPENVGFVGDLFEVFCVQDYFDWKFDKSYRQLDQFIFLRENNLSNILKSNEDNKSLISKQKDFNSETFTGIKFLNREEILSLEKNLINSGNDDGFIAFIPVKKVDDEFINNFNSIGSQLKIFFALFSDEEKSTAFSYKEISKLLGYNIEIRDRDWQHLTTNNPNPKKKVNNLLGISKVKSLSFLVDNAIGVNIKTNFDINNLFDLFFRINFVNYNFKDYKKTFDLLSFEGNTDVYAYRDYNLSYSKIIKEKFLISTNKVRNKTGNFLLLSPQIEDAFNRKLIGIDFRLKKTIIGDPITGPNDQIYDTKYLEIEKQIILETKINLKNSLDEKVFTEKQTTMERFERLFYTDLDKVTEAQKFEEESLIFIKNNYSIRLNEILKEQNFQEFVKTFYSPDDKNYTSDFSNLIIGEINTDFSSTKSLRSYKNFEDFISYYKSTVEGLAEEATDRV